MSETKDTTYNGWKNYETWNVALWFDNDEPLYRRRLLWTQDAWDIAGVTDPEYAEQTREDRAKTSLAKRIKEYVEDHTPTFRHGMYVDLLNAALSEVDWYEIAENWLTELIEERK